MYSRTIGLVNRHFRLVFFTDRPKTSRAPHATDGPSPPPTEFPLIDADHAASHAQLFSDNTYRSNGLAPNPLGGSFGIAPRVTVAGEAGGPGPGAYPIKGATGDTFHFSMRGREKFGSPTGRSDDPACKSEPGPGAYPKVTA